MEFRRVRFRSLDKWRRGRRPQEITQTQEALNQALAVARDAARNFDRQSQLLASGAASQKTVDAARAARDQAVASVNAARAAHSQAAEGFRKEDIAAGQAHLRSEEHTSELQSLMRISYAVFCLKKKKE